MEEVHRLHKDVPFGWVAMLQEALEKRATRKAQRRVAQSLQRRVDKRAAAPEPRPYSTDSRFIRGW